MFTAREILSLLCSPFFTLQSKRFESSHDRTRVFRRLSVSGSVDIKSIVDRDTEASFFSVVCLWSCPPLRVLGGSAMNLMLQIRHQAIRNPPNHLSRGAWMSTPGLILAMIGRLIRTTAIYKGIDTRSTVM